MPLPSADKPSDSPADARPVMLQSPREAAARAIVYRRRQVAPTRERGLRVAGLVGTLLVHLLVLFGAILGPAYDLQEPRFNTEPLQVRLIENPEPPPPPPVRGTPPRRVGPAHHGRTRLAAARRSQRSPALPALPKAKPDMPVISVTATPAALHLARTAAPIPPLALPHPRPTPELAPVPLAGTAPQVRLDAPPVSHPVPPKFQPEPVRKPQAEGDRPMPTPPSLALPAVPAQAPPPVAVPTIALDQVAPPTAQPPSPVRLTQPQPPMAPAAPDVEPVPLPAQAAPRPNLTPQLSVATPAVPREQPHVQAPTVRVAEPQLSAIPLGTTDTPPPPQPATPNIELSRDTVAAVSLTLAHPQAAAVPSPAPAPEQSSATAAESAAPARAAPARPAPDDASSRAPDAVPQGSDSGVPGAHQGQAETAGSTAATGMAAPLAGHGTGQGEGRQGKAQPGAAEGAGHGRLGSYIQLKPHGDTDIMEHRAPDIGYRPTRFEDAWTPEGESSIDTALRHAVEKTTVKHTFHLPRGVRVKCAVRPLFPIALFGCNLGDPPAKAAKNPKLYERLDLAPARPLDPTASASVAKAQSASAPAPIHLDNAAECAAARVSGGPLPPGCKSATPALPPKPASGSSSWVPASDQFP